MNIKMPKAKLGEQAEFWADAWLVIQLQRTDIFVMRDRVPLDEVQELLTLQDF